MMHFYDSVKPPIGFVASMKEGNPNMVTFLVKATDVKPGQRIQVDEKVETINQVLEFETAVLVYFEPQQNTAQAGLQTLSRVYNPNTLLELSL